jgi:uncharacterized protein (DUF433 family)
MDHLNRITQSPDSMGGRACIRGMRVTVSMVAGQIAAGHSIDDVLAAYPYVERDDVLRPYAMQLGVPKSARSCWLQHETCCRYEPIATVDSNLNSSGFRRRPLE